MADTVVIQLEVRGDGAIRVLDQTGQAVGGVESKVRAADAAFSRFGASIITANQALQLLSRASAVVGTLFTSVTAAGSSFETGIIGVAKTTNLAGAALEALSKQIEAISFRVPVAAKDLLGIAQVAGQLGVKGVDAIAKFSETVGQMGISTNLAGETAASALAVILNLTNTATDQVDRLGAVIARLGDEANSTEAQLADVATRIATNTKQFGLTAAQVTAIGTALSELGIESERGGTAVQQAFLAINTAVRQGGRELEVLRRVTGQTAAELKQSFEASPVDAFVRLLEGLRASGRGATEILTAMGISSDRASGVLVTLGQEVDRLKLRLEQSDEEWRTHGKLIAESSKAAESYESQTRLLAARVDALKRDAFQAFRTEMGLVLDVLQGATGAMHALGDSFPLAAKFAGGFVLAIAAIGKVGSALGTLVTSVGVAVLVMDRLGITASIVTGALGKIFPVLAIAVSRFGGLRLAVVSLFAAMATGSGPIGVAAAAVGVLTMALGQSALKTEILSRGFSALGTAAGFILRPLATISIAITALAVASKAIGVVVDEYRELSESGRAAVDALDDTRDGAKGAGDAAAGASQSFALLKQTLDLLADDDSGISKFFAKLRDDAARQAASMANFFATEIKVMITRADAALAAALDPKNVGEHFRAGADAIDDLRLAYTAANQTAEAAVVINDRIAHSWATITEAGPPTEQAIKFFRDVLFDAQLRGVKLSEENLKIAETLGAVVASAKQASDELVKLSFPEAEDKLAKFMETQKGAADAAEALVARRQASLDLAQQEARSLDEIAAKAKDVAAAAAAQKQALVESLEQFKREEGARLPDAFVATLENRIATLKTEVQQITTATDPLEAALSAMTSRADEVGEAMVKQAQAELAAAVAQGAVYDELKAKGQAVIDAQKAAAQNLLGVLTAARAAFAGAPPEFLAGIDAQIIETTAKLRELTGASDEVGEALAKGIARARGEFELNLLQAKALVDQRKAELDVLNAQSAPAAAIAAKMTEQAAALDRIRILQTAWADEMQRVLDMMTKTSPAALELAKAIAAARAEAAGTSNEVARIGREVKAASGTVRVSLAAAFRQGISESLQAVIQGTRKMSEVWEGVKVSIIRTFADAFAESLQKKLAFDDTLQLNVRDIAGWFSGLGSSIKDSFSGVFSFLGKGFAGVSEQGAAVAPIAAAGATTQQSGLGVAGTGFAPAPQQTPAIDPFTAALASPSAAAAPAANATQAAAQAGATALQTLGLLVAAVFAFKAMVDLTGSVVGKVFDLILGGGRRGQGASEGAAEGAKWGALFFGIGAFVGAIIGAIVGAINAPTTRNLVGKALADSLSDAVRSVIPLDVLIRSGLGTRLVPAGAPQLSRRLAKGKETDQTDIVLGLLAAAGQKSPFDTWPEFKLFGEATGKIAALLDRFPDQQDEMAQKLASTLGGSMASAIDLVQSQILKIVRELRGESIGALPAVARTRIGSTEQQALQDLVDKGFLVSMEDAVTEIVNLFGEDLPRAVKNSIPRIVDDAFGVAQRQVLERETQAIMDQMREAGVKFTDDFLRQVAEEQAKKNLAERGDLTTVKGEQIQKAIELESQAFADLAEVIAQASQSLLGGATKKKVIEDLGVGVGNAIQKRAAEGLQKAFFQTVDFDNLLSPLFFTLERGIGAILDAETPEEAAAMLQNVVDSLGTQFEAVSQKIETLGPVVEKFAELQEELRLSLTSFAQAAEQTRRVSERIDEQIAGLQGRGSELVLEKAIAKTADEKARAVKALFEPFTGAAQAGKAFQKRLKDLSDNELKKVPELLAQAADAIVANANAQIAALEQQLQLAEAWSALVEPATDALAKVRGFGRRDQDAARIQFGAQQEQLQVLLRQFREGSREERIAAAQALVGLAPQLLESAQSARFLPGSSVFEGLRATLEAVLSEIRAEGLDAQDRVVAIQEEIRDIQAQAVAELQRLQTIAAATQAELEGRHLTALKEIDENTGVEGPIADLRETNDKILERLNIGINTFNVTGSRGNKNPFSGEDINPPTAANGGIFIRREGLVLAHGPEAIVPLDRMSDFSKGIREVLRRDTDVQRKGKGDVKIEVNVPTTIMTADAKESDLTLHRRNVHSLLEALDDPRVQRKLSALNERRL